MRKMLFMVLAVAVLLLAFAAATPSEAIEITIQNDTKREVSVVFYYHNAKEQTWIIVGWYNANAGQSARAIFTSDTKNIYYYAIGGGLTWDDASGPKAAIVHETFSYDPKKTTLSGKNLQTVGFRKLVTDGKASTLQFLGTPSPTPTPPPPVTPPPPPPPVITPPPPTKPPIDPTKPPVNQETPPKSTNPNGSYWMLVGVSVNDAEWKKNLESSNKHPVWKYRVSVSSNSTTSTRTYVGNNNFDAPWMVKGGAATGEITWTDPPRWMWPDQEFSLQLSVTLLKCTYKCSAHPKGHQMNANWWITSQLLRGDASHISYMKDKNGRTSVELSSRNAYQSIPSTTFYGKFAAGSKKGERRGVRMVAAGQGATVNTTYTYEWM